MLATRNCIERDTHVGEVATDDIKLSVHQECRHTETALVINALDPLDMVNHCRLFLAQRKLRGAKLQVSVHRDKER